MNNIQNVEIDWSKAPEWATVLLKHVIYADDYAFAEAHRSNAQVQRIDSTEVFGLIPSRWNVIATHPQPTWNGEGLPPVGTVCALTPLTGETVTVTIKYMGKDLAVVQKGNKECVQALGLCIFRLIRTPDKIAAEEREKVIEEMRKEVGHQKPYLGVDPIAALYDAGYRKLEKSK